MTLKVNPQKYNGPQKIEKTSTINFQAQREVLLSGGLNRGKFMIRYESLNFAYF